MQLDLLKKMSRSERLREIVQRVSRGETLSSFDLAVMFDVTIGVIYYDVKVLKAEGYIPKDWQFARRKREQV